MSHKLLVSCCQGGHEEISEVEVKPFMSSLNICPEGCCRTGMQLHIGAEHFGNTILQKSELTSKCHIGA
jgi:hypothetical protein